MWIIILRPRQLVYYNVSALHASIWVTRIWRCSASQLGVAVWLLAQLCVRPPSL